MIMLRTESTADTIADDALEELADGFPDAADGPIHHRWPLGLTVGVSLVGLFVLLAALAPVVTRHDPVDQDILGKLANPSLDHWLGTDALGRDVFTRIVYALRTDIPAGVAGAAAPLLLGVILGSVAGFIGGLLDSLVMRLADLLQAFPPYVLLISIIFTLGSNIRSVLVAFLIVAWVPYARLVRTEILRVRETDYIKAASAGGLPRRQVLVRHVLPNTIRQPVIYFASDIVAVIITIGAISFLGLGVPPGTIELGVILSEGQPYMRDQWWLTVAPGFTVAALGLGLSLIADSVDTMWREA